MGTNFCQVQTGHFFVKFFRQEIHSIFVLLGVVPQFNLGKYLVSKGVAHDKAWMSGGASQVHQSTFSKHDEAFFLPSGIHGSRPKFLGPLTHAQMLSVLEPKKIRKEQLVLGHALL